MSSLALVEFLAARLDEDEQAQRDPDNAWHPASCGAVPSRWRSEIGECDCGVPARVLREVEAKRAIITACDEATIGDDGRGAAWLGARTLERLALAYSDHPDYQESWRP